MTWLNPLLLFGLGLVVVPVVLHMLLQSRPKPLVFPALRLLQMQRQAHQRRFRIRHWWLLLLRMAVIAGLVLALARPSLPPANYRLSLSEWITLLAIAAGGAAAWWMARRWWAMPAAVQSQMQRQTLLNRGVLTATIVLIGLLVVWPYQRRVSAEMGQPSPQTLVDLPVAAVFLCDTSLSMEYQLAGQTRLQQAQQMAMQHLEQLPSGSKVAVFDSVGTLPAVFSSDLTSARNRLEALEPQPMARMLEDRLLQALRLHNDDRRQVMSESGTGAANTDRFVREVYVFTDLTKPAWASGRGAELTERLKEQDWVGLYIIDVGIEQPVNTGLIDVRPLQASYAAGGPATLDVGLTGIGAKSSEAQVEFWVNEPNGVPLKQDEQTALLAAGSESRLRFVAPKVTGPFLQGEVRLSVSDPLPCDNRLGFTIRVLPPQQVLVVAADRATARYWLEAMEALSGSATAGYQGRYVSTTQFRQHDLSPYDTICLLTINSDVLAAGDRVRQFVGRGGGLCVCLGGPSALQGDRLGKHAIDPLALNQGAWADCLPATLKAMLLANPPKTWDFSSGFLPLTQRLEELGALAELSGRTVSRYWSVAATADAVTLARWSGSDQQPAVLMRDVDRGRSLMMSTAACPQVDGAIWNDLPASWTFVALIDQWLQLVSRQNSESLHFQMGDTVAVSWPREKPEGPWLLRSPDGTQRRLEEVSTTGRLELTELSAAGNYQVLPTVAQASPTVAFSVLPPPQESDLQRLERLQLDELFGPKRYGLARAPQELQRSVQTGRLGQEVYSLLVTVLIVLFLGEQLTATWFYRSRGRTPAAAMRPLGSQPDGRQQKDSLTPPETTSTRLTATAST
jgi:hypothetical protein